MARIVGCSDCTGMLIIGLRQCGLDSLQTLNDIDNFYKNFNQILNNAKIDEKQRIDNEVASLKLRANELIKTKNEQRSKLRRWIAQIKIYLLQRKAERLERKRDKIVANKVAYLLRSHQFLDANISFYYGAIGEEAVIKELNTLPDSFYVFNGVRLAFNRAILWRKYMEYVRTCQIDHVIIGPPGIFLVETKNWSGGVPQNAAYYPPHKQIERSSFAFYIKMINSFGIKFPIYNIVVMIKNCPKQYYEHTQILSLKDLTPYVLSKGAKLSLDDVYRLANWIQNSF